MKILGISVQLSPGERQSLFYEESCLNTWGKNLFRNSEAKIM